MTTGWQTFQLDKIAEIIGGGTPKTSKQEYWGGDIPWLSVVDFNNDRRYVRTAEKKITEMGFKNSSTKLLQPGDTIISARGTVGVVAQIGYPMAFNQSCYGLRAFEDLVTPDFLYYLLTCVSKELKQLANGGVFDTIIRETFSRIQVQLPPIKEQNSITEILNSFDDYIENLKDTNSTLEDISQTLFKSWFIDFDPVHAKAEGREPERMDAEKAALFPDGFEESSLGLIPKGWHVTNLDNAYQINPIRKLKKGELAPYLDMANVPIRGHHADKITMREMGSGTKFINGDTLLARITPCLENGKTAFVDFLDDNQVGWGSTEFVVLRPKEPIPLYHGYLLARHSAFREFAIQSMSGTSGRQRIQNNVLGRYSIVVPDYRVLEFFGSIVSSIQQKISSNSRQAKFLASQRNILLPQLISGQVSLAKRCMKHEQN